MKKSLLIPLLLLCSSAASQSVQIVTPNESVQNQNFGKAVSIDGDVAIVGSGASSFFSGPNVAYMFQKIDGVWQEGQKLEPSVNTERSNYGTSVSIAGDIAVVGDHSGELVYVYRLVNGIWIEEQTLFGPEFFTIELSEFGFFVVTNGFYIVVTDSFYPWSINNQIDHRGTAYIYRHNGTEWELDAELRIPENDFDSSSFVNAVALSGNVLVTQSGYPEGATSYVFRRTGASGWTLEQELTNPDGTESDVRFFNVKIDGDTIAISADDFRNIVKGKVYIFEYTEQGWVSTQTFDEGGADQIFGRGLELSETTLAVTSEPERGVQMYHKPGEYWEEFARFRHPYWAFPMERTVSLSGSTLLIGSPRIDINSSGSGQPGAAFFYNFEGAVPGQVSLELPADNKLDAPSQVFFAWNLQAAATSYRFQVSTTPDFSDIVHEELAHTVSSIRIGPLAYSTTHYWRVRGSNGTLFGPWSETRSLTVSTGVDVDSGDSTIPSSIELSQNYPNPFNPITTISFDLPEAADVSLVVYNVLGHEVARLVDKRLSAASYDVSWDAAEMASGLYHYKLAAGSFVETKAMVLLK